MESARIELHYTRRKGTEKDGEWKGRIKLYQEVGYREGWRV